MKFSQKVILTDTVAQGLLLIGTATGPVIALATGEYELMFYGMYGMIFLGAWQFSGNLLWMLLRRDNSRLRYFWVVLAFFFLGYVFTQLIPRSFYPEQLGVIYWFGIPYGIAIWYFRITAAQLTESFQAPRSFWDI